MICKHSFILVDWVNGGMSDPYFDLATFCVFHGLNEKETEFFLTRYFERDLTEMEWNRFVVTQPIRLFVIATALFPSNNYNSMTYEEIIREMPLPTLSDFGKKGAIWPHFLLGVSMFQAALTLIDQEQFRFSLQSLKKACRLYG